MPVLKPFWGPRHRSAQPAGSGWQQRLLLAVLAVALALPVVAPAMAGAADAAATANAAACPQTGTGDKGPLRYNDAEIAACLQAADWDALKGQGWNSASAATSSGSAAAQHTALKTSTTTAMALFLQTPSINCSGTEADCTKDIKAWQTANGIQPTGILTEETLAKLKEDSDSTARRAAAAYDNSGELYRTVSVDKFGPVRGYDGDGNPIRKAYTLSELFDRIITIAISFGGVLAISVMVYGGAMMVLKMDSSAAQEQGISAVKAGAIGLALSLSAYALVAFTRGLINLFLG